jgi:hypothetical protein
MELYDNYFNLVNELTGDLLFTIDFIDDFDDMVPGSVLLKYMCKSLLELENVLLTRPNLHISDTLYGTINILRKVRDKLVTFRIAECRQRSMIRNAGWKLKRAYLVHELRETFMETTDFLQYTRETLKLTLYSADTLVEENNIRNHNTNYRGRLFWQNFSNDSNDDDGNPTDVSWDAFITAYERSHLVDWNMDNWEHLRCIICHDGYYLNVIDYTRMIRYCEFPINKEKLQLFLDNSHHHTNNNVTPSRMELVKSLNNLMIEYTSKEFRDKIMPVFQWYKGCDQRWQERANEWAEEMKKTDGKPKDEMDKRDQLAEQVNSAKKVLCSFFERYMVCYMICYVSDLMYMYTFWQ